MEGILHHAIACYCLILFLNFKKKEQLLGMVATEEMKFFTFTLLSWLTIVRSNTTLPHVIMCVFQLQGSTNDQIMAYTANKAFLLGTTTVLSIILELRLLQADVEGAVHIPP